MTQPVPTWMLDVLEAQLRTTCGGGDAAQGAKLEAEDGAGSGGETEAGRVWSEAGVAAAIARLDGATRDYTRACAARRGWTSSARSTRCCLVEVGDAREVK